MIASVHALLAGIVDYAGLFPPAKLPLDQAIRNYAAYRSGSDAWMLGRFICPAANLTDLTPYVRELFASGPPLNVSALGRGGNSDAEFFAGLQADVDAIADFRREHGSRVSVDVLEVRLPATVIAAPADAGPFFHQREELMRDSGLQVYCEPAFASNWRANLTALLGVMGCGVKIRCGGLEAAAFPTTEQLAFALVGCRQRGLPFKATAGLHHPLRHFDGGLQVPMHGFLNVFCGGVLAHTHLLKENELRLILEDEDPASFRFDDAGFAWRKLRATTAQIAEARAHITSFGSCSFDEPCADLRVMGLL